MINYIAQRIGIYYKDKFWLEDFLNELLKNIPEDIIIRREKDCIRLKDGTFIKAVRANSNAKGHKFDKIFMQSGIDEDTYEINIRPAHAQRYYHPLVFDSEKMYDRHLSFEEYPLDADFYYETKRVAAEDFG